MLAQGRFGQHEGVLEEAQVRPQQQEQDPPPQIEAVAA